MPSPVAPRRDVHTDWFVRMRWGAVGGQVVIILAAHPLFGIELPVATLLAIAAVMAASNAILAWIVARGADVPRAWRGAIMAFDTLELTALLFISGGTSNPFSVFYLVQIVVAAVTLGSRWTWSLAVLGVSSYAALFLVPGVDPADAAAHAAHLFAQHLVAMWIALTLSAALVTYFVTRLTAAVAERDARIAAMREAAERHERLAALTTLAAGAAHELGTPLATVSVAAGELQRAIERLPGATEPLREDVQLIRSEIRRCRDILDGMAADSGHAAGEMPSAFTGADLVADLRASLSAEAAARLRASDRSGATTFVLPRRAVGRAVLSLVRNALAAAPGGDAVSIDVEADGRLWIRVRDTGPGIPPDLLPRIGEPFFTTRAPGEGLGLGLFLVRSLAEHLGGDFTITSRKGEGTTVVLVLPYHVAVNAEYA